MDFMIYLFVVLAIHVCIIASFLTAETGSIFRYKDSYIYWIQIYQPDVNRQCFLKVHPWNRLRSNVICIYVLSLLHIFRPVKRMLREFKRLKAYIFNKRTISQGDLLRCSFKR